MQPKIITELKDAIRQTHGCEALYVSTVHVREKLKNAADWDGFVRVFELIGHPTAKRCYAWSYRVGKAKTVAVILELTPVTSAEIAVTVANSTMTMLPPAAVLGIAQTDPLRQR
jgi:hypothetical protein